MDFPHLTHVGQLEDVVLIEREREKESMKDCISVLDRHTDRHIVITAIELFITSHHIITSHTRKFSDLMSQCMYPCLCRKAMALTASRIMASRVFISS